MVQLAVLCAFVVFLGLTLFAVTRPRGTLLMTGGVHAATALLLLFSALMTGILYDDNTYIGDLWTAFDAMNKTVEGQRSSVDYFNPIGPVYEWILALALHLRAASATTVLLAGAIAGALAALLGGAMLSRRMSGLGVAMALLATAAAAVSGREIDALFTNLTVDFLAPYNRWGWAFLIPVALRLATPARGRDLIGAMACGFAIAALLCLKATYGVAALGLLACSVGLRVERLANGLLTLAATAAALLLAQALTGQILPYFHNLQTAAHFATSGLRLLDFNRQAGEMMLAALLGVLFLALTWQGSGLSRADAVRAVIMLCLVAGMGSAVLMQNHYVTEAGLYCILPLIAVEWTGFLRRALPRRDPAIAALLVALAFVTLRPAVIDTAVLASSQLEYLLKGPDPRLAGTALHDLRVHPRHTGEEGPCDTGSCNDYARMLSGLALLQKAGAGASDAGRVLTLNFSNPFPILLDKPSPRAAPIWFHKDRSFSETDFTPPEALFGDVGFVMIARNEGNAEVLSRIYHDSLARDFTQVAEDPHWLLLRRKNGA